MVFANEPLLNDRVYNYAFLLSITGGGRKIGLTKAASN
ncbi:hypothetical protein FM107_16250 [Sphingobacterium sp. JB170]|nr:hypothetical protein FM107_16250 [Sphingobacterium sp. JB170]